MQCLKMRPAKSLATMRSQSFFCWATKNVRLHTSPRYIAISYISFVMEKALLSVFYEIGGPEEFAMSKPLILFPLCIFKDGGSRVEKYRMSKYEYA